MLILIDTTTATRCPFVELFDSRCAERIARDEQYFLALGRQLRRQLPERRRLPSSIHAYRQDDMRLLAADLEFLFASRQYLVHFVFEQCHRFFAIALVAQMLRHAL